MSYKKKVTVIGGANMDIGGNPYSPLVSRDSNPGSVSMSPGGVGRNIAHNLAKLGLSVSLITAIGDDHTGAYIKEQCEKAGIDMSLSLILKNTPSSVYLYINDHKGDMALALSHMDIVSEISPSYLRSVSSFIRESDAVVADCNISREAFKELKDICKDIPLFVDPVSTAHSKKIKGDLDGIDTLKPNRLEAGYLTDIAVERESDIKAAAAELIRQGVKRVFISAGEGGVAAADKDSFYIVNGIPSDVVSTTGAGDSAAAAIVWASLTQGSSLITASKAANAAAAMTVSVNETNAPDLSAEKLVSIIECSEMKVIKI